MRIQGLLIPIVFSAVGCATTGSLRRAEELSSSGRSEAALAEYFEFLEQHPNDGAVLLEVGRLHMEINRPAEAMTYLRRARTAGAPETATLKLEARGLVETGQPGSALPLLERVVELDVDDQDSRLLLAELLLESGDVEGAKRTLKRALVRAQDHAATVLALARLYDGSLKRYAHAVSLYDRFLSLAPTNHEAQAVRLRRRELLMTRPEVAQELEGLDKVARAEAANDEGHFVRAVELMAAAQPADGASLRLWAAACAQVNDMGCALEKLRAAVAATPEDPILLMDLVRLLRVVGRTQEARALVAAGRQRFPKHEGVRSL